MTQEERQLITGLADRVRNAPAPQIDREADELIRRTIGSRPDALYILTQTVLVQEMALNQAKAQIEQLKQQAAPQQSSFLNMRQQPANPAPAPSGGLFSGGGFSGFLRNAATTAAGIVAGEIAFDSIASLFGHHGGFFGGGGGGFFSGGGGISPGSETIVNNYYGNDHGDTDSSRFADVADRSDDVSPDIEDERDNSGDSLVSDDSSFDSGGDDSGSFDV